MVLIAASLYSMLAVFVQWSFWSLLYQTSVGWSGVHAAKILRTYVEENGNITSETGEVYSTTSRPVREFKEKNT